MLLDKAIPDTISLSYRVLLIIEKLNERSVWKPQGNAPEFLYLFIKWIAPTISFIGFQLHVYGCFNEHD